MLLVGTKKEVEHLAQCTKTMRFVERGRVLIDEEATPECADLEPQDSLYIFYPLPHGYLPYSLS